MKPTIDAERIRIYVGESDQHKGHSIYEGIVEEARRRGLAGATVLHGIMGFGARNRTHSAKILRLSENLPVIIEIVDTPRKIAEFLPYLDQILDRGSVTIEPVKLLKYSH